MDADGVHIRSVNCMLSADGRRVLVTINAHSSHSNQTAIDPQISHLQSGPIHRLVSYDRITMTTALTFFNFIGQTAAITSDLRH